MKHLISTAGLAGSMLLASGVASADALFQPGLYETRVSYPGEGTAVEVSRDCLTPAEARSESLSVRLAEATRDPACRYTQRSIAGGRFAIAGTCTNDGIRTVVRQTGTYTATSMSLDTRTTLSAPGMAPVTVDMRMSSRRLAATCPADRDSR